MRNVSYSQSQPEPQPHPQSLATEHDRSTAVDALHATAPAGRLAGQRAMFGLALRDMGWSEALAFAETVVSQRPGPKTLSFLDGRTAIRLPFAARSRPELGERILLSGSRTLGLAARWHKDGPLATRFEPRQFVGSLLTFMEDSRRVALVGTDAARLERTRMRLSHHAPWHDVVTIAAVDLGSSQAVGGPRPGLAALDPDLVIVDANGIEEEARFQQAVALRHDGLIVMAGAAFDGSRH